MIKKNLILCSGFLLAYIIISVLQYLERIYIDSFFDIRYSIYTCLSFFILCLLICNYWEKIPPNVSPDKIIMKRFKYLYIDGILVIGIIAGINILNGNKILNYPDVYGMQSIKILAEAFLLSINRSTSFFQDLLLEYGLFGALSWIVIITYLFRYILQHWKKVGDNKKIYFTLSILFLIQTFFYRLQQVSTPIYLSLIHI